MTQLPIVSSGPNDCLVTEFGLYFSSRFKTYNAFSARLRHKTTAVGEGCPLPQNFLTGFVKNLTDNFGCGCGFGSVDPWPATPPEI